MTKIHYISYVVQRLYDYGWIDLGEPHKEKASANLFLHELRETMPSTVQYRLVKRLTEDIPIQ